MAGWNEAFAFYVANYELLLGAPMSPMRQTMAATLLKDRTSQEILAHCEKIQTEAPNYDEPKELAKLFSRFERREI